MPEAEIAKAVQLLDLMLEFFADDSRWTRGGYDDGKGGRCMVGALLHLGRAHSLPTRTAIALLQDAMPRAGLPLVHFNDRRCGSVAKLRSVILTWISQTAGFLGRENAHRAASGRKNWRLWVELAGFNFCESLWEQWSLRWLAGLCWPRFLVRQAVVATVSAACAARYSA